MKKSNEQQIKQQKVLQIENQLDEGSRSNYGQNQFHQYNQISSNYHNDHSQNFNKKSFLDFNLNDHLNHILNNQQNQEVHQLQLPLDYDSYMNRRELFSQPNNIYQNNNIMQLAWSYNNPSEHLENYVKRQDNFNNFQKQYREWPIPILFQVKDQPIDEDISNYFINHYQCQKQDLNQNPPFLKEQNVQQKLIQQNQLLNIDENIVKLQGSLQLDNQQKIDKLKFQQLQSAKKIRRQKVQLYLKKKNVRNFTKKITYQCRKQVADKRIRLKGRFINYKQAVIQLKLDPNQKYQVSFLKQLIKKIDQSGCVTPASNSQINPEQLQKDQKDFPILIDNCQRSLQNKKFVQQFKD